MTTTPKETNHNRVTSGVSNKLNNETREQEMGLISGGKQVENNRASVEKRRNAGNMNDYLDAKVSSTEFNRNRMHDVSGRSQESLMEQANRLLDYDQPKSHNTNTAIGTASVQEQASRNDNDKRLPPITPRIDSNEQ